MTGPVLDHHKAHPPFDEPQAARTVARSHGKSIVAQRAEIFRLRRGPGMLTAEEYYYFRLYEDERLSAADRVPFLGLAAQDRILAQCTDRWWWALPNDKLLFHTVMRAEGIPVPEIVATYHRNRSFRGATALRRPADLATFLRSGCDYPLFGKPFDGMYSVGCVRLDAYDPAADELVTHTGARVAVADFIRQLRDYRGSGYMFQKVVQPHERAREMCGDRVACMRVVLLLGPDGPEIFRTLWKMPAGKEVADNFWRSGNMLAPIDVSTGRITRAVAGAGFEQRVIDRHPDTGQVIAGFTMPDWDEVKKLCLAASSIMPRIRMQAWDIAACPDGPMVIEANIGGDFNLPQLASDTGLLDDRFGRFLAQCRYRPRSGALRLAQATSTALRLDDALAAAVGKLSANGR